MKKVFKSEVGSSLRCTNRVTSNPLHLNMEGLDFLGSENLIYVLENRANYESREIPIHYFKFEAKVKSNLPPLVFLCGGPGDYRDTKRFYECYVGADRAKAFTFQLKEVNKTRDLLIVNQRGNSDSPGFPLPDFKFKYEIVDEEQFSEDCLLESYRKGIEECSEVFKKRGVDVAGYDILNLVDDIEDIRQYYGYDKLAFSGGSFGSQCVLAYIMKYQQNVDRAIISGVEPLDHTYKDPKHIWKALVKLEVEAMTDNSIKQDLPDIGLIEAVKVIVQRLKESPKKVRLVISKKQIDEIVTIGIDDFRKNQFLYPFAKSNAQSLATWPKYITELYNKDYRILAYISHKNRGKKGNHLMIAPLMDNSLGISNQREALLNAREENEWLGDINAYYKATKSACPTKEVPSKFRQHLKHNIPILMIQGELDMNTPYENATFLLNYLENGHLLTVERGTHNANGEVIIENPILAKKLMEFMNVNFEDTKFQDFKKHLPKNYALPKIKFTPIVGKSFYDIITN